MIASILLLLVLWVLPEGSFIMGAMAAGVMLVGGFLFLKGGAKAH